MASSRWTPQAYPWKNYHETIKHPIKGSYVEWYPSGNPTPPYGADTIRQCVAEIQEDLREAAGRGHACRAVGRAWSLSKAPVVDGALFDLTRQWAMKPLRDDQIHEDCPADWREGLWLIQAGAYVSEINRTIESDRFARSMPTTGAANGQTIAGAFSTGTHGSIPGVGAIHDHIAAIHLITGPDRHIWLEREDRKVMKPSFPAAIGAELVRDTDQFRAVQMGLGSFGIIANVVLKTRPRMMYDRYNMKDGFDDKPLLFDAKMRHVLDTLEFDSHPGLVHPEGRKPHFFQPIFDPNNPDAKALVTLIYERPWDGTHQPDYALYGSGLGPGYDVISSIGPLLDIFKKTVPLISQLLQSSLFTVGEDLGRSWGELFGYKSVRTKVASGTVAVPMERTSEALDALFALNAAMGGAPLAYSCRYVAKSDAFLAMNRFDQTCVISLDGIWNKATRKFLDAVPDAMEAAGIPYTQHWGKTNGYTPKRLKRIYGDDYDAWIRARHELLASENERALFNSEFMKTTGLDR